LRSAGFNRIKLSTSTSMSPVALLRKMSQTDVQNTAWKGLTVRLAVSGLARTSPSINTVDSTGMSERRVRCAAESRLRFTTSWVVPDESLMGKKDIALDTLLNMATVTVLVWSGAIAVHTAQGAAILRGRHGSLRVHGRVHRRCGCVGGMGLGNSQSSTHTRVGLLTTMGEGRPGSSKSHERDTVNYII